MADLTQQFIPSLRALQPAALAERFRRSLFVIPGTCVILGATASELVVRADRDGYGDWLPLTYDTSAASARAMLAAIATGSLTVVTLVLTFTLVAVQLAAGQLSPRTITNYLGDRFQQVTIGLVLATTAYSLAALRTIDQGFDAESPGPNLTLLTGFVFTIVAVLFLLGSVDRMAARLQVGLLIDDLASETCTLVRSLHESNPDMAVTSEPGRAIVAVTGEDESSGWEAVSAVSADRDGWVQVIDEDGLLDPLPDGARLRLLRPVGTFVYREMVLVEIDREELDDETATALRHAIVLGDARTMQQDIGYGITRLVDIGLRALSPGVNDANTAREVILRLGQVILVLQHFELPGRVTTLRGRELHRVSAPSHDDYVVAAFEQLRLAARNDPAVLATLVRTLATVEAETERLGLPGSVDGLRNMARLAQETIEAFTAPRAPERTDHTLP